MLYLQGPSLVLFVYIRLPWSKRKMFSLAEKVKLEPKNDLKFVK